MALNQRYCAPVSLEIAAAAQIVKHAPSVKIIAVAVAVAVAGGMTMSNGQWRRSVSVAGIEVWSKNN